MKKNSTSPQKSFHTLHACLRGSVDDHFQVISRFDYREQGTISESQWFHLWLASLDELVRLPERAQTLLRIILRRLG